MTSKTPSREIFDEFIIEEHSHNRFYSVFATDKALELLGLTEENFKKAAEATGNSLEYEKERMLRLTLTPYYRAALLHYIKENYPINAIFRASNGDAHDAFYQEEITILNSTSAWDGYINKMANMNGSAYSRRPIVIREDELTDERIWEWAQDYDLEYCGEDREGRKVLCTDEDGKAKYEFFMSSDSYYVTALSNDARSDKTIPACKYVSAKMSVRVYVYSEKTGEFQRIS